MIHRLTSIVSHSLPWENELAFSASVSSYIAKLIPAKVGHNSAYIGTRTSSAGTQDAQKHFAPCLCEIPSPLLAWSVCSPFVAGHTWESWYWLPVRISKQHRAKPTFPSMQGRGLERKGKSSSGVQVRGAFRGNSSKTHEVCFHYLFFTPHGRLNHLLALMENRLMSFCPHWSCVLCQAGRQVYNLRVLWSVYSKVLPLVSSSGDNELQVFSGYTTRSVLQSQQELLNLPPKPFTVVFTKVGLCL